MWALRPGQECRLDSAGHRGVGLREDGGRETGCLEDGGNEALRQGLKLSDGSVGN